MLDIDWGSEGSSGPFLSWSAKGSMDGEVPARSFTLRTREGKEAVDLKKGAVFDVRSLQTGWQRSEGVAGMPPEWLWNDKPSHFRPKPEGEGWKRGFSLPVALGDRRVVWEQAAAGAWDAIKRFAVQLGGLPSDKMPVGKLVGVDVIKFSKGSTVVPILELVKYISPPACFAPSPIDDTPESDGDDGDLEF